MLQMKTCKYDKRVFVLKWMGKWRFRFMHVCMLYEGDSHTYKACPTFSPFCNWRPIPILDVLEKNELAGLLKAIQDDQRFGE